MKQLQARPAPGITEKSFGRRRSSGAEGMPEKRIVGHAKGLFRLGLFVPVRGVAAAVATA